MSTSTPFDINTIIQEFMLQNKTYLYAYVFFTIAYPISTIYLPKFYGNIIEDVEEGKKPNLMFVFMLIILVNIMYLVLDKLDNDFMPKLQAYVKTNVLDVIMTTYKNTAQEQNIGKLVSKIVKLPIIVRELAWQTRNFCIPLVLIVVLVNVQFTLIDPKIGAYTTMTLALGLTYLYKLWGKCMQHVIDMDEESDEITDGISELLENLIDIHCMGTKNAELHNLGQVQKTIVSKYKQTFDCTNTFRALFVILGMVVFVPVIYYSYNLYSTKKISLPDFVNIFITSTFIINRFSGFSTEVPDFTLNLGIYLSIRKFLLTLPLPSPDSSKSMPAGKGDIRFHNVGIKYNDKPIIENFNLHIPSNSSISLVGRIGSGKSTLAKSVLKLKDINSGTIYIDGADISDISSDSIRSQVLYIRQNPTPYNRTLYENISYGTNATKQDVQKLLNKYDLNKFFNITLDDKVGRRGDKLSGGQRQMIFLLRVLLSDKRIIILDEPTASLDPDTTSKVLEVLRHVINNRTTILITHDPSIAEMCDKVVRLS
jgi:ABC-type multidrug transport system fused ATPase/permease subunit